MTRKNYEEIADIIRDEGYIENGIYISDYRKLIGEFCKYFKGDNNAFIAKKFRDRADSRRRENAFRYYRLERLEEWMELQNRRTT